MLDETLPRSLDLSAALQQKPDCAVVCTDHSKFDYDLLVNSGTLIVDTRNALRGYTNSTITRL